MIAHQSTANIFTCDKVYRMIEKTPTTLNMLCRTANWSLFRKEPMSGNARCGRSRPSKCPFHMSLKRTKSMQHKAGYKRGWNCVPPPWMQSLQRRRWTARKWSNKCGCLERISIAPYTLKIRPSSDITGVSYTKAFNTTPQKIIQWCEIWWSCWPWNWSPSTNPSIWVCNVEVFTHISIKVCWSSVVFQPHYLPNFQWDCIQ